jgi:hypothetical protein
LANPFSLVGGGLGVFKHRTALQLET